MSRYEPPTNDLTSEAEFENCLDALVRTAIENGVDVHGGWTVYGSPSGDEIGIEIFPVEREDG